MNSRLAELHGRFVEFDREFPEVGKLFDRFALERIGVGFSRYSADAVMHRVRWETAAGRADSDGRAPYKINNDHVAFYARRFMASYPEHDGFFSTREQTSAARRPKGWGAASRDVEDE